MKASRYSSWVEKWSAAGWYVDGGLVQDDVLRDA